MMLTSMFSWLITYFPILVRTVSLGFLLVPFSSLCNISVLSCCIMWSSSQQCSPTFGFVISLIFVLVFGGLPLSLCIYIRSVYAYFGLLHLTFRFSSCNFIIKSILLPLKTMFACSVKHTNPITMYVHTATLGIQKSIIFSFFESHKYVNHMHKCTGQPQFIHHFSSTHKTDYTRYRGLVGFT